MNKILDKDEPILNCQNRFVMFPVKYKDIFDMYKKHVSTFWVVEEIDFTNDISDWNNKLSDNDRKFLKYILAFFAASDGIVNENLSMNFMNEVEIPEARAFYAIQSAMETIHSETYSLLIDTYIKDEVEKDHLFNAIREIPCVKKKADWALKWVNDENTSFAQRLISFAIVEGIQFSGSFCAIFWLKEKGLANGLTFSNELISRDEGLHVDFAVLLYKHLNNKLSEKTVHDMFKEAVAIEKEFINESIPCKLLGMNEELMNQYIEFVADRLLLQLNYNKIYESKNPFDFMDRIALTNKSNFFEQRVAEYAIANVGNKKDIFEFKTDEDF